MRRSGTIAGALALAGIAAACTPGAIASGEGGLSRYLEEIRKFPDARAAGGVHARQAVQGA
jgi:hypothetical protein